ncbi:MAG: hypothetical protein QOE70_4986 [Chthoniobacter sp.]|jgi:hypothetical protein|nr:hypothetical protein [Chthoniobacter sp.]
MKLLFSLLTFLLLAHTQAQTPAEPAKPDAPTAPAKRTLLKYTPPKTAASGTRHDGDGGSRGSGEKLPSLYVLAPNHTALTTREQPSLFWFQTGPATTRLELTLTQPKNPKPLLKVGAEKAGDGGIHRIPLAKHNVTLTPGVTYKWSVALVPDPANRSQDVIASGTIQRIEPEAKLTAALGTAKADDRAPIYAANGIWYDALEALSDQIDAAPKDKGLRVERAALLDQAGLKDAAAADRR